MRGIVTKTFGDTVVFDHFAFEIPEGKFTALTGESGVGKTTLLRILAGVEPYEGEIPSCSPVAFLYQTSVFLERLSLAKNLELAGIRDARGEAAKLGLADAFDRSVGSFSGGMKRRSSILRAALFPAELYLLDEPLKELDPENYDRAATFLREKLAGKTVLFSTHRESEVALFGASEIRLERR